MLWRGGCSWEHLGVRNLYVRYLNNQSLLLFAVIFLFLRCGGVILKLVLEDFENGVVFTVLR